MSTAREAGLTALQSGDLQTAISQLEAAVQENPSDFDACLYLGGAYGQAGRPLDAIKSVTQAVQLQPANAQARYNLGVAMEQGGFAEQALQVYSQAVHLQPDYPKAQEAVARLHASSNQGFGAPPSGGAGASGSGQQFAETQPEPAQQSTQQMAQPGAFGQQPAVYNPLAPPTQPQPTAYNPLAPPPQQAAQPPAFGRPTVPVGQAQQPVEAGLGSYMAPPPPAARAPGGPGAPSAYGARPGAYSSMPSYDDEFKLGQAFKDLFRALFTPRSLFSEMAGCDTARSAWALFVVYAILMFLMNVINGLLHMSEPTSPGLGITMLYGIVTILMNLVVWVLFAGIVQMLSRAFGSSLRYGASVRCVMYGAAPFVASMLLLSVVSGFMAPQMRNSMLGASNMGAMSPQNGRGGMGTTRPGRTGKPGTSKRPSASTGGSQFGAGSANSNPLGAGSANGSPFGASGNQNGFPGSSASNPYNASGSPFGTGTMSSNPNAGNPFGPLQAVMGYLLGLLAILLISVVWGIILLGVAVSNVHEISGGAAAGVAILSAIISAVIGVGLYIVFAVAVVAAVMGAMSH